MPLRGMGEGKGGEEIEPEKEERQPDLPRNRNGVPEKDVRMEDGVEEIV